MFKHWRGYILKEMYYFDPEYPDTNITNMVKSNVSLKEFDFFFEKSQVKKKAFDPETRFFAVEFKNQLYVFKKGENDPFLNFISIYNSVLDAKKDLNLNDENTLFIKKDLDF